MRIIVFWDSIAEWLWDHEKWWWVQRLKTDFWKKYGYDNFVIWFWISAHTSSHLKNYIKTCFEAVSKRQADKHKESIVIISIGINDSAIWIVSWKNQVDYKKFKNNIIEISNYLKSENLIKKVLFLWNTNVVESMINKTEVDSSHYFFNSEIQKYNNFIFSLSDKNGFDFLSLFWIMDDEDLDTDWLHPNSSWHRKIYNQVKKYLELNVFPYVNK